MTQAPRNTTLLTWLPYFVVGLVLGGVWLISSGESLWTHTLRAVVVFAVVLLLLRVRLNRRTRGPQISFGWFIGTKLVLILLAAVVQWLLDQAGAAHPDVIVAAGLVVLATLTGPLLHHRLVTSTGVAS